VGSISHINLPNSNYSYSPADERGETRTDLDDKHTEEKKIEQCAKERRARAIGKDISVYVMSGRGNRTFGQGLANQD
jgi:hypothetical protein